MSLKLELPLFHSIILIVILFYIYTLITTTVPEQQVPTIPSPNGQDLYAAVTESGAVIINGLATPEQLDIIEADCADTSKNTTMVTSLD
jgi:hypothetical protein